MKKYNYFQTILLDSSTIAETINKKVSYITKTEFVDIVEKDGQIILVFRTEMPNDDDFEDFTSVADVPKTLGRKKGLK